MTVEGIWALEVHGAYAWESRGVFVLEDGRAINGGDRHYSVGRYSLTDEKIKIEVTAHYFGEPRMMFGEKRAEFSLVFDGEIDGDHMAGVITRPDRPQFTLGFRMTRMMDVA